MNEHLIKNSSSIKIAMPEEFSKGNKKINILLTL